MGYVNEVLIVGRLGANPELDYTKAGMAVCRMSVATHQKFRKGTQTITETEWHRIVLFGRRAEIAAQNLKKGGEVYVKGVKRTSQFLDSKTGQQRQRVEIITLDIRWPGSEKMDMTGPQVQQPEQAPLTPGMQSAKAPLPQRGAPLPNPSGFSDADIERELLDLRRQASPSTT